MSTEARAAIEIDGLRVSRGGRVVLACLSVQVASRSVTGLLGPSGCGKTTLMRAIVGVQRIDRGNVRVFGTPAGAPALRSQVGYRPQADAIYGDLTVGENLRYFARIVGVSRARVDEVLELVGLGSRREQIADSLSGGERARLSLAITLLGEPDLLVLDEPTVGLDPLLRSDLWSAFHRLAADGATLLVSSHVMDEASECDALLLMREGAILERTTPAALRRATGEADLSRAFLRVIREAA